MKKNDKIIAKCIDYTADGQGVVKVEGYPLFVKGLIVEEVAQLKVLKANKNYGYAMITELIEESDFRRELPCPYAKLCGGCQLQYMEHEAQGDMKHNNVQSMMQRIGKVDVEVKYPLLPEEFYYRNKTQIPVQVIDGQLQMGFYRRHSNEIIDMESCMIQSKGINDIYIEVKKVLKSNIAIAKQLRHVLFKHAVGSDSIMIVFITKVKDVKGLSALAKEIAMKDQRICSIIQNINTRNDNVILGEEEVLLYGEPYIIDTLLGIKFAISSKSFYQINYHQTEVLYNKAIALAGLKGNERILDLFCGIGTISLCAAKSCKEVVGVEIVEEAIINAKKNAEMNQIDNATFVCSDAASFASELEAKKECFDVIIVDPPRKGLDDITIESICKINPEKIVYVSCDPSTLARDLNKLTQAQFECIEIQPVDMFPQTYHVENVVILHRR